MVGVAPAPDSGVCEFREIKSGILEKRSQNKSITTRENYQARVFVLDTGAIRYFLGTEKERGDERGSIDLSSILAVEAVQDGLLPGKKNAFQVAYTYELDGSQICLYVVAPNVCVRDNWITAIRTEAVRSDAALLDFYHRGILVDGVYNCCSREAGMEGCEKTTSPVTMSEERPSSAISTTSLSSAHALRMSTLLVDNMVKRSQGRSSFFKTINYKSRTFVLDANSLRYYEGDLRIRRNERCRIHLTCVVTVEPVDLESIDGYKHGFQVVYFDNYDLLRLYVVANSQERQNAWVKTIKKESVKHGAEFLPSYHAGLYIKNRGRWACCDDINPLSEGCRRVITIPEMKLCGADMNVSITASQRAKSPTELKVSVLWKKSQNKSTFFSSNRYQERVFTLDSYALAYYSGFLEDRGKLKGSIPLVEMLVVEQVRDGMLDDKINVFQVVYHEDKEIWNLYIVANSEQERMSWISSIKRECTRSNVILQHRYHPGVWIKAERRYNCCRRHSRDAQGCAEVTGMSLISMRDRSNTMESLSGYRQRLGTLDSVPENAIAPSPARPNEQTNGHGLKTPHYGHNIQVPDTGAGAAKRPRYLRQSDGVPLMSPPSSDQQNHNIPKDNTKSHQLPPLPPTIKKRAESKEDPKPSETVSVKTSRNSVDDSQHTRDATELSIASVGLGDPSRADVTSADPKKSAASSGVRRSGPNTPWTPSVNNSRQASSLGLDSSKTYSEDFESISELSIG